MDKQCHQFMVAGHVQGVGFRYHTAHQGLKLGLTGYAKNLPSGEVEVVACGGLAELDQLHAWLQIGPKTARITKVTRSVSLPRQRYVGFAIL
ncbi:acylphosphatase [Vibrio sp. HDW18]|uniref:acylphosphatase n=1 Tax=Vibrio sp. HDW18 TaxID=2714948 RepID=UPI0014097196|nr:acylphosphatase [Vibrio sp. HDW18]QIL84518.1 acylphosphatase [Vibrio sp. HDW18]